MKEDTFVLTASTSELPFLCQARCEISHFSKDEQQESKKTSPVDNWFWLASTFLEVVFLAVLQQCKKVICGRNRRHNQPEPVQILNFIQVNNFAPDDVADEDSEEEQVVP